MDGCQPQCSSTDMIVLEHETAKLTKINNVELTKRGTKRCMCCLPTELLLLILGHLSVLDYLSFRSVCRCWRFAFSQCPISFPDQLQEQLPWVVFLRADHGFEKEFDKMSWAEQDVALSQFRPVYYTTGKIGDSFTRRVYDIPEMCEKRLLLSKYGWLLLFSSEDSSNSSLFFFNPFSGSRIDLPCLDVSGLKQPAFAISSPPTSEDCIVFITSCIKDSMATDGVKIGICRRGESAWTKRIFHLEDSSISVVINVSYARGVFYCVHRSGHLSEFDVSKSSWNSSRVLKDPRMILGRNFKYPYTLVSCEVQCGSDIILYIECDYPFQRKEIKLKESFEVIPSGDFSCFFTGLTMLLEHNPEKGILSVGNQLRLDSFGPDPWFDFCEYTRDGMTFNWCRYKFWQAACFWATTSATIAWLEPRWVQPLQCLSWNS